MFLTQCVWGSMSVWATNIFVCQLEEGQFYYAVKSCAAEVWEERVSKAVLQSDIEYTGALSSMYDRSQLVLAMCCPTVSEIKCVYSSRFKCRDFQPVSPGR